MIGALWEDLRAGVGFFTRIPVGTVSHLRPSRVMLGAPLVGTALSVPATLVGAVFLTSDAPGAAWLAATAALATVAYLTAGLHLDGLADLADGLGARRDAAGAMAIMHRSDIGPFGVVTLLLVLLAEILALGGMTAELGWRGLAVGLGVSLMAGRLGALWLCRAGVPAAEGSRSGAWVAGTVAVPAAGAVSALALAAAGAVTYLLVPDVPWAGLPAVGTALLVGQAVQATARRRLGGITGDVLGAAIELGQCTALLVLLLVLG